MAVYIQGLYTVYNGARVQSRYGTVAVLGVGSLHKSMLTVVQCTYALCEGEHLKNRVNLDKRKFTVPVYIRFALGVHRLYLGLVTLCR
jgi:hypothetical protein